MFKVGINYHLFFALAVLIFNATWSKHCGKVQKYTFKVQQCTLKNHKKEKKHKRIYIYINIYVILRSKYKLILSIYKSELSKYKSIVSKNKSIVSKYKVNFQKTKAYFQSTQLYFQSTKVDFQFTKYTFKVQKCPFKVKSNFRNLGNGISGTRNLLNTSGFRNLVPRASSVQTSEQTRIRFPELVPRNRKTCHAEVEGEEGLRRRVMGSRFLEMGSFPEPPQLAQNTPEYILHKDPIAFCYWAVGEKKELKVPTQCRP